MRSMSSGNHDTARLLHVAPGGRGGLVGVEPALASLQVRAVPVPPVVLRGDGLVGAVAERRLEQALGPRGGVRNLDAAWEPLGDLLEVPRVAVGIRELRPGEVGAALRVAPGDDALARLDVPDLADVGAAADQVLTRGLDVVDDDDQALQRAVVRRARARPELDRRLRAGRRELHAPYSGEGLEVDVEPPSEALVEGLRPIDVRDRQCGDLEL